MKRLSITIIACFLLCCFALGCGAETTPTPISTRTPQPTRAVSPTLIATVIPPTGTPTNKIETATATIFPSTSTAVPTETLLPTFTASPFPTTAIAQPTAVPLLPTTEPSPSTATLPQLRPFTWDPRLDALNIQYIPADVSPGQTFWRLTHAEYWAEEENQGKHHIFVNVLDEGGARILGQEVTIEWLDGSHIIVTEDKPAPEYAANYPIDINHYPPWHSLGAYSARVNGLPSDVVKGMGRPPPKSRPVAFLLTFQKTIR